MPKKIINPKSALCNPKYRCLSGPRFEGASGYALVPLREEDLESIRGWRNAQLDILRQKAPISKATQKRYFVEKVVPTFSQERPDQILFSFLKDDKAIGYGGLTHIDWEAKRAEVSFLLDPVHKERSKNYSEAFFAFLTLLREVTFEELGFHRLFTETYAFRKAHIALLESFGFQLEGRMRHHVFKKGTRHDSLIHGLLVADPIHAK